MIIDFRIRPPLPGFLESSLYTNWGNPRGLFLSMAEGREPVPAMHLGINAFLEEFDNSGIDMGVIIGRVSGSSGQKKGAVTVEEIADFMELRPGRFRGISAIDAAAPDAVQQVRRAKAMGMSGVCAEPFWGDNGLRVNAPQLMDAYHAAEEEGLILVLTLNFICGNTTAFNQPRDIEDVAVACPKLKIVVPHACYPKMNEFMAIVARYPGRIYTLPDCYFYFPFINTVHDQITMYNHMLQDQVIYGSAYPIRSLKQALRESLDRPWLPEPKEKFLWKNAATLLGLDIPTA